MRNATLWDEIARRLSAIGQAAPSDAELNACARHWPQHRFSSETMARLIAETRAGKYPFVK